MELTITSRHHDITEGMKRYALEKGDKLQRFADLLQSGELTLNHEDDQFWAEVHLYPKHHGGSIFAKEGAEDMYAAIDLLLDKAERLLKKQKGKAIDKARRGGTLPMTEGGDDDEPEETYQDVIENTEF